MAASEPPHLVKRRYNLKSRYDILKSLGQGTYGKVKLAVDKVTGLKVAIKSISKRSILDDHDLIRIRREIDIMASVNHKHVIQILEVLESREKIIIVMEYAEGGELFDHISSRGKLTEKEARRLFRQIVSAVHYLHENGIVHRDLKLENILLDKHGQVKLADFGLSNTWNHNSFLHTFCGSPLYASPEIINGRLYYGPEVDCWSLGVLLYTLVYGGMPFDGTDYHRLKKQISTGSYFEPVNQSSASSLIQTMLTVNPAKRANITDIASHWWINKDCSRLDEELSPPPSRPTSDYFEDDGSLADEAKKTNEIVMTSVCDFSNTTKEAFLKNSNISSEDSGCELSFNEYTRQCASSNSSIDCVKPETVYKSNLDIYEVELVSSTKLVSLQQDSTESEHGSSILSADPLTFDSECLAKLSVV